MSAIVFRHLDPVVEAEVRASTYAYGAGVEGVGIQITIDPGEALRVLAVRLPEPVARTLAASILAALEVAE